MTIRLSILLLTCCAACAVTLLWEYPQWEPGTVFNVYQTTNYWTTNVSPILDTNDAVIGWTTNVFENARGWIPAATVTGPSYTTPSTGSMRFFTVTASNTLTGMESAPATR